MKEYSLSCRHYRYAATAALISLGTTEALECIDREAVWAFLLRMCVPAEGGGGMAVHEGGEVDIRSCYLAVATAHMLQLDTKRLAEASGCVDYIRRCQTYEVRSPMISFSRLNEMFAGYCDPVNVVLNKKNMPFRQ